MCQCNNQVEAKNLRTAANNNGAEIPNISGANEWVNLRTAGFEWHVNQYPLPRLPRKVIGYMYYAIGVQNILNG